MFTLIYSTRSYTQPGTIVRTLTLPVPSTDGTGDCGTSGCSGVSIAVDCAGNLYYNNYRSDSLYTIDINGNLLARVPTVDAATGLPIFFGELAWDNVRNKLWAGTNGEGSNYVNVYLLDPATGLATHKTVARTWGWNTTDGLAYDNTTNRLYLSQDISTIIDVFSVDPLTDNTTFVTVLTPKNASDGELGTISGVEVSNNILYLGQAGTFNQIVTVDLTTLDFLSVFLSPAVPNADLAPEGLECDGVNFPGREVLWQRHARGDKISAVEVEAGTCHCNPSMGSVNGQIIANCPSPNTELLGVRVDAFQQSTGNLVASDVTDVNGNYEIDNLATGNYMITLVTPLGYSTSTDEALVTVTGGAIVNVNFSLTCINITANPRTIGFWKHQVGVATGGNGTAQISASSLCNYLDLIADHFNSNLINQVIVYQPPLSGVCSDKLQIAKSLLNLVGSQTMIARARQQLMALLMNIAAGYISQAQVISADGATVSQAVTYCDNLIDNPTGNHELAKTIADQINNNQQVAAGVIPLSTEDIRYKVGGNPKEELPLEFALGQNYPNPFNPTTVIYYALPTDEYVTLKVYNMLGQEVLSLVNGTQSAGYKSVTVDATTLPSGIYTYRLHAGTFSGVKKMLLIR